MRVLVACEFSGVVRDAFIKRGHDAYSCDILDTDKEGPHIQDDVLNHLDDGWDLMIAHPPCTFLTVSANRWMKPEYRERFPDRERQRYEAMEFFMRMVNAPVAHIAVENPIGVMSSHYRKPEQVLQPWMFGHPETKATCLWLKGLKKLEPTRIMALPLNRAQRGKIHYLQPSPDRSKIRSITFKGIADAMAQQWG